MSKDDKKYDPQTVFDRGIEIFKQDPNSVDPLRINIHVSVVHDLIAKAWADGYNKGVTDNENGISRDSYLNEEYAYEEIGKVLST